MSADVTWLLDRAWLLAGVLAVVAAVIWWRVQRHRTRAHLVRALRDPVPARRRAAVGVATEQGLRTHSRLLAPLIDTESDPSVRAALVEGVLRNAWEPADRESILRLRLWAHEEHARRPSSRPRPATGAALAATTAPVWVAPAPTAPVSPVPVSPVPVAPIPVPSVPTNRLPTRLPTRVPSAGMPRHRAPSPAVRAAASHA